MAKDEDVPQWATEQRNLAERQQAVIEFDQALEALLAAQAKLGMTNLQIITKDLGFTHVTISLLAANGEKTAVYAHFDRITGKLTRPPKNPAQPK